jgi:hypothetical protein
MVKVAACLCPPYFLMRLSEPNFKHFYAAAITGRNNGSLRADKALCPHSGAFGAFRFRLTEPLRREVWPVQWLPRTNRKTS